MAASWKQVNKFRLFCLIMITILSGLMFDFKDDYISFTEFIRTLISTGIVAFAFLQCPDRKPTK